VDIYSDHRIPFSTGVWLRTHKFSPTAVKITRALQLIAKREQELLLAEAEKEAADQVLRDLLADAEQQLESSSNGY
jgi:hypothetical protein